MKESRLPVWRRRVWLAVRVVAVAGWGLAACDLSPQPLPPASSLGNNAGMGSPTESVSEDAAVPPQTRGSSGASGLSSGSTEGGAGASVGFSSGSTQGDAEAMDAGAETGVDGAAAGDGSYGEGDGASDAASDASEATDGPSADTSDDASDTVSDAADGATGDM